MDGMMKSDIAARMSRCDDSPRMGCCPVGVIVVKVCVENMTMAIEEGGGEEKKKKKKEEEQSKGTKQKRILRLL